MPVLVQPRRYHPRRTLLVAATILLLILVGAIRERKQRLKDTWRFGGEAFGSTYAVSMFPTPSGAEQAEILGEMEILFERAELAFSTYRSDSELARFNAASTTNAVPVSPMLHRLIATAQKVAEASGGAFDVTCGPVLSLWRFEGGEGPLLRPDPERLAAARGLCGWKRLHVEPGALRKDHPGVQLNVNAIAPGYMADLIREFLAARGHGNVLVDVGGEFVAAGLKKHGRPWRVGIQRPTLDAPVGGEPVRVADLRDRALATSGDYRNYRRDTGGRVVSHIFDPRAGEPISAAWASVTVVAPTGAEADAWATALYVLGPDQGCALLVDRAPALEALFLLRAGEDFSIIKTGGFPLAPPPP